MPAWLDLAREFTETWVHHQQIRHALGRNTGTARLGQVLRIFVWALPHQYRVEASPGTNITVDLAAGGAWTVRAERGNRWTLHEGGAPEPLALISFTDEAARRTFAGADLSDGGVTCVGTDHLTAPVLHIRAVIA